VGPIQLRQSRVGTTRCPLIAQKGLGLGPNECTAGWTLEREAKGKSEKTPNDCKNDEPVCTNWNAVWDRYWLLPGEEQAKMKGSPLLIPSFFGMADSNNYGYQVKFPMADSSYRSRW
jgi:hypothetical protein